MTCHPACLTAEALLAQCTLKTLRRSGPGGQHRNKVETAVVLFHEPTSLQAEANERRSQADNKQVAIQRLRLQLAIHHRTQGTASTGPSELWRSRCRQTRIGVAETHWDFPCLLAELFDYLTVVEQDLALAAQHFATTSSQLVKLLRKHPAALVQVNAIREKLGKHRLS